MNTFTMTDVVIVVFDLRKCRESPGQEAGPLRLARAAHVYICYQVRATRGNIMINKTKF